MCPRLILLPCRVSASVAIVYCNLQRQIILRLSGIVKTYPLKRIRELGKWVQSELDGRGLSYICFAPEISFLRLYGGEP